MRSNTKPDFLENQRGVALLTVMIFALVVGIAGLAFFALASYENKGARNRQHSTEAFYLADGAVERAKAEVMENGLTWRGPIATTSLGSGTYNLSTRDTSVAGKPLLLLHGEGRVRDTERGVEAFAELIPLAKLSALWVNGTMDVKGQLTVNGHAHANGGLGSSAQHIRSGTYDDGYTIKPPKMYTDPALFEKSTYYRVTGAQSPLRATIERFNHGTGMFEAYSDSIETSMGIVGWDNSSNAFVFSFTGNVNPNKTAVEYFFETNSGVFKINHPAGDEYVMVDFSQINNGPDIVADVVLHSADDAFELEATIVNTRFEGVDDEERRWPPCNGKWVGGYVTAKTKMKFAPRNCIAVIAHNLGPRKGQVPNAQVQIGTVDNPALTYITGNVNKMNGDISVNGSLIALCDFHSGGGPTFNADPSFFDCLPDFLQEAFNNDSGIVDVVEWREVGL